MSLLEAGILLGGFSLFFLCHELKRSRFGLFDLRSEIRSNEI